MKLSEQLMELERLINGTGIEPVIEATEKAAAQEEERTRVIIDDKIEARDFLIYNLWELVKYYKANQKTQRLIIDVSGVTYK